MSASLAAPVDPVTLGVVAGALSSAVAEMSVVIERTARSPVVALSHDYSNAIYTTVNGVPEMVVQGQDQPCHLGGMLASVRNLAQAIGDDLAPGDAFIGNDPVRNGTHLLDIDIIQPIFVEERLVGWACSRAHEADLGGPVAGGYNPEAEELYAECLIIPPTRLVAAGRERTDVLDLILANVRAPEQLRGDLGAQLSATRVAVRRMQELYARYDVEVDDACRSLLDRSERLMREQIRLIPDGRYEGEQWIQDDGRGTPDSRIGCVIEVRGDEIAIEIASPPQCTSYRNSYWGLTIGAVYYAVLSAVAPGLPMNEGLYRPITVTPPPLGTMLNPRFPAAAQMSTADVWGNVFDAVCDALSVAVPERACAGWQRIALLTIAGVDPRTDEFYGSALHIACMGGAGALAGQDGGGLWGVVSTGGGSTTGDIELLEFRMPLHFHRHELATDSASPGQWRGALGVALEFEVQGHEAQIAHVGDGSRFAASSRLGGGGSRDTEVRVHHKQIVHRDGTHTEIPLQALRHARDGDRVVCAIPGGGAVGPAGKRDPAAIERDVEHGYVSRGAVAIDYATEHVGG